MTIIRSIISVCRIFNFDIYSFVFVIKIAILVKRAVLIEITKPALGFNIANVLEPIV